MVCHAGPPLFCSCSSTGGGRPSVALPGSRVQVMFPTSSHVLSGSDRVCGGGGDHAMALGKLYVPRTQSTVERGGGGRNPSVQATSSTRAVNLSSLRHLLSLLAGVQPRRIEKGAQLPLCDGARSLPHTSHPCPQMAQCCFGDGLKRLTTADSHCLI